MEFLLVANRQYIPLIYHFYIANWVIIWYLPPIKGTFETAIELSRFLLVERYTSLPGMCSVFFRMGSSVGFIAWEIDGSPRHLGDVETVVLKKWLEK